MPKTEVSDVRLLDRTREAGKRVESAQFQVDMALLKMTEVLDKVEAQVEKAKEELHERRASG